MKNLVAAASVAIAVGGFGGVASAAQAQNLLVNPGFETGDFTGWTQSDVQARGDQGEWYVIPVGTKTPFGVDTPALLATGGSYLAVTDMDDGGVRVLSQTFSGVAGTDYALNFEAFVFDGSGVGPVGSGLGLQFNPDNTIVPNQHVEVSIDGEALYSGIMTPDWATYSFDISKYVVTGTNSISFSEVDTLAPLVFGLDNVSVTPGVVPEPAAWALMILGLGLAGSTLRRRRPLSAISNA